MLSSAKIGRRMFRIKSECDVVIGDGQIVFALVEVAIASAAAGINVVWFKAYCLVEIGDG